MRRLIITLFLAFLGVVPATAAHAQRGGDRAAMQARRDSLEAEVVQKFVEHVGRDLELSAEQKDQITRRLTESGRMRYALMRESSELRQRMYRAVRTDTTSAAVFTRLLATQDSLRRREQRLWAEDREVLARLLTPRQQVHFLVTWANFQDNMREIISDRLRKEDGRDNGR